MHWCWRAVLQEDMVVPPRSQADLSCKLMFWTLSKDWQADCWNSKPIGLAREVLVARTLDPSDKFSDVPVAVMNVHNEPHTIHAGAVVRHLEPTLVIEPELQKSHKNQPSIKFSDDVFTRQRYSRIHLSTCQRSRWCYARECSFGTRQELLLEKRPVFSESENNLGLTDFVEHHLDTDSAMPVRQQLRRFPPAHVDT